MALELDIFPVSGVSWGQSNHWTDGQLELSADEFRGEIRKDKRIKDVQLALVAPGEITRVIHVLDIIQPRIKSDGTPCFPGFLSPANTGGQGITNVLEGVLIVTSARVLGRGVQQTPKEAVLDMFGPGAALNPFSTTHLVVLSLALADGLGEEDTSECLRLAGLRVATLAASATCGGTPAVRRQLDTSPLPKDSLPAVAVSIQLGGTGPLNTNYVAAHPVVDILPSFVRYEQMADGLIVGGNFTYAGQRNYTCQYQQNALLDTLMARNGASLRFAGAVVTRGYSQSRDGKLRMASLAAGLVERLGADGVIITTEGSGNAQVDTMLTCQECEKRGIRATIMVNEMSDSSGSDPGLVDFVPEADAIVSVGNREEIVDLPAAARVVGTPPEIEGGIPAAGPLQVPLRTICGSTNEMGAWNFGVQSC